MPVQSVFKAISPPRASSSKTMCDLAMPPMDGLQLMRAAASGSIVTRAVRTPSRAAASAASQPAWPAPITTTSKEFIERVGEG